MEEKEIGSRKREEQDKNSAKEQSTVEQAEESVPGIKHEREPDAENIMPAEDRPGTL